MIKAVCSGSVRIVCPFVRFKDDDARRHFLLVKFASEHWRAILGDCLAPHLKTGDAVLVDFDRKAFDGDLVLAAMKYRRAGWTASGQSAIEIREAVKQLRVIDGEEMLCAREESVYAGAHEVLGAVVGWYRPGWWRRPSPKMMTFHASPAPQ